MSPENELLTTKQAADYLKVSESWLNQDRAKEKVKVPFVKMGARLIRYRKSDLIKYINKLNKA